MQKYNKHNADRRITMTIKKKYQIGALEINAKIEDEVVALVTNMSFVTKQIYELGLKNGRQVYWDARRQMCMEKYTGKKAEEIEKEVDAEINKIKEETKDLLKVGRR